jgi:zinc finger protein 830
MADVRALLKAKRQEARIAHPLASYNVNGQLRCVACGTTIKHASAWEGHLGSKVHRTNVVRLKEEERKTQEVVEDDRLKGKRKASFEAMNIDEDSIKRRRVELIVAQEPAATNSTSFPDSFFSDPSRAAPLSTIYDSDDEAYTKQVLGTRAEGNATTDLEWENFERALLNTPDHRETYARATVIAEPVLASETPEGFPPLHGLDPQTEIADKRDEEVRRTKEQDERCAWFIPVFSWN